MRIVFLWTNLAWDKRDEFNSLCEAYGFIPKWQSGVGWSFGIFEDIFNQKTEELRASIISFNTPIVRMSKSRNDVQAKSFLQSLKVGELKRSFKEIQRENHRQNKKLPKTCIEDCFPTSDEMLKVEEIYKYKFSNEEIEQIQVKIKQYINSYGVLYDYFHAD